MRSELERHRPLRGAVATLLGLKLVVNTAFRFVYPFLPAISRGLGINLSQAGLLVSTRWAAGLVTPTLLGLAGPVRRSRRVLLGGVVLFVTGSLVVAWTGIFVGAVVGFLLLGLAKPLVDISSQIYVSERVSYINRARYLGTLEVAWAGGLLFGAPLAGWLIENWSWETPFWVVGSLGLAGLGVALLTMDDHDEVPVFPVTRAADSAGRHIAAFLAVVVLFGFAHEGVMVVLGVWLEESFGLSLLALGGVGTLLGLSELAGEGAMVSFTDRIGKRRSMILGMSIGLVSVLVLSLVFDRFAPSMIALVLVMAGLEFGFISGIPLATELRPSHRGRVLGWFFVASSIGRVAGDVVAPRIFTGGGMAAVSLWTGAAILAALVVLAVFVRDVEDEPAQV